MMNVKVKLVVAGVNIGLLLATLMLPTISTPIALIPIVVSLCTWIFTSDDNTIGKYIILIFAIIIGIACSLLGIFASDISTEIIKFRYDIAFVGNMTFEYKWFAIPAFISLRVVSTMLGNVITARVT